MPRFRDWLSMLALALLCGCGGPTANGSNASGETSASKAAGENAASPNSTRNCLAEIWQRQGNPDRTFDERNDDLGADSISCDGFTSPSALQRAIDRLKSAAADRDADRITRLIHLPFHYIDREGRPRRISSRREFRRSFDTIFNADAYSAIASLRVRDVTPDRGSGLFFHVGGLWFSVANTGDEPALMTINHEALDVSLRSIESERSAIPGTIP